MTKAAYEKGKSVPVRPRLSILRQWLLTNRHGLSICQPPDKSHKKELKDVKDKKATKDVKTEKTKTGKPTSPVVSKKSAPPKVSESSSEDESDDDVRLSRL